MAMQIINTSWFSSAHSIKSWTAVSIHLITIKIMATLVGYDNHNCLGRFYVFKFP